MEQKQKNHTEKMTQLKKHFKFLKRCAILLWLAINIVFITVAILFFSVEVIVFSVIIEIIITTMIMINYLNRLDKIRIAQETQLLEDTPMGRLKF